MKNSLILIVYFLSLIGLIGCSFSSSKALALFQESEDQAYDVIIVPGVPLEDGKWSDVMKGRICWSKFLYDKGIAKNIMYSGSAVYTPYIEAEVMALYGEAMGISKDHIFTEKKAEHSTENVYYGYQYAKQLGFTKIALASDPFQTKMLKQFVKRKLDNQVALLPMIYDSTRLISDQLIDPLPDFEAIKVRDFESIKDRESFWERLKGTRGKKIDKTAYQ